MMRILLGLSVCLLICSCGIKPGQVRAPESATPASSFPATYPDMQHGPQPIEKDY